MVVGDAHVFPGFLTPVLTQLSFQSHQLLFSHASAQVRGEKVSWRNLHQLGIKLTTTRSWVWHNHHWATWGSIKQQSTISPLSKVIFQTESICRRQIEYCSNGEILTLSQTSPSFSPVCRASLLAALWKKEKLLVTSNFSFYHSVFHPFGELSAIFIKFENVICKLLQFGRV